MNLKMNSSYNFLHKIKEIASCKGQSFLLVLFSHNSHTLEARLVHRSCSVRKPGCFCYS